MFGIMPTKNVAGASVDKPGNFFALLSAAATAAKQQKRAVPDFLDYLNKSGFKTAWVRAIVALYEEPKKPDDPLAYILKLMGLGIPDKTDVKRMQVQAKHLRTKLLQLQHDNEVLKEEISVEEEAAQQRKELVNLYDDGKYFSEYNSEEDFELHNSVSAYKPDKAGGYYRA
ncbi:unnamed protein product [Orchesella dallaii]|uniref:c-Myc-binding protein n=1 Tax=Orchesella dallaii TaxID=48710 RepID=A0ABP1Q8A9_9HEXA